MSATVTSGFDRWHDDQSRNDSASAAADGDDSNVAADADTLVASNDAFEADPNAEPDPAKRFLSYAPFPK